MPVCTYRGCSNSSKKKMKMNSFPRNPVQQAKWIKNMALKGWKYHPGAVLCEAHFEPHMWEKIRVDGTKKLKYNAVPTIFGDRIVKESDTDLNGSELVIAKDNLSVSSTASSMAPFSELSKTNCIKIMPLNTPKKGTLTSILKPRSKAKNTSLPTLTFSKDVLDQLKMSNSKTPIIIPASSSLLKSKIQLNNTESVYTDSLTVQSKSIIINQAEVNTDSILSNSNIPTSIININLNEVEEDMNSELLNSESSMPTADVISNQAEANSNSDLSDSETFKTDLNRCEPQQLLDERFEKMDKLLLKQLKLNDALRKKLLFLTNKLHQLEKEETVDYKTCLADVFTDDQIKAVELRYYNPKSTIPWSHKTMMKAIKLKQECGTRGYEELLKQNLPFPSIRTISRWCTARNVPIP